MVEHWEDGDYYEQDGAYVDEDSISPDYSDFLYDQWKDEQTIAEYKKKLKNFIITEGENGKTKAI